MIKRILAFTLTALFLLTAAACGGSENPATDFEYEYNSNLGGVVITKYVGNPIKVQIPKKIEGEPVVGIGEKAFEGSGIKEISIPNSVTRIGERAFDDCAGLTNIAIPDSVTSVGREAFRDISDFTATYKGTDYANTTIVNSAGWHQDLPDEFYSAINKQPSAPINSAETSPPPPTSNLPENPATDFEYEYNSNLGGVVITKYVGDSTKVRIPEKIEGESVVGIRGSTGGTSHKSIFYNPTDERFDNITEVHIPNSVTSIGENAFAVCTGLTSVTIPDGVTNIGYCAFYSCIGLTSVTIPDSVTSIGDGAFSACKGLTSITIPDSMTSIGDGAFSACKGLTSITIPNSVTSIGENAFADCKGLTSITIPNSVTSIGNRAFANCIWLMSVTIPDSVTSIGEMAFGGGDTALAGLPTLSATYKGTTYTSFRDGGIYDLPQEFYDAVNGR